MGNITIGIDFSITSPGICIHTGDEWKPENCSFFFVNGGPKKFNDYHNATPSIHGLTYPTWDSPEERFHKLSNQIMWIVEEKATCIDMQSKSVAIEDYAFGARGRLFHIGEACGILKNKLYIKGLDVDLYAPTEVKKYATTKGGAKKGQMIDAFVAETGWDLVDIMNVTSDPTKSVVTDLVDAYFICKFRHFSP